MRNHKSNQQQRAITSQKAAPQKVKWEESPLESHPRPGGCPFADTPYHLRTLSAAATHGACDLSR
jgi:hypothetical protein